MNPSPSRGATISQVNAGNTPFTLTNPNTFSGGLLLVNGAPAGTRLRITGAPVTVGPAGAIVSSPFGTGPITIGEAPTDKADTDKELILTAAIRTGTAAFSNGAPSSAASVADGITYSIQGSTDLASFTTTVNAVPTVITTGLPALSPGYSYRSFSLEGSNGLPSKGFLRAAVTAP